MLRLRTPDWVKQHTMLRGKASSSDLDLLKKKLAAFQAKAPEVSIVLIAKDEQEQILGTLSSLSEQKIFRPTEILIVNNASTDGTADLLQKLGINAIFEAKEGIGWARQAGLQAAKGVIIVNADSDSIYPPSWSASLADTLQDENIAVAYTRYAFIPSKNNGRWILRIHEAMTRIIYRLRRRQAAPANVMGFSFAFRKTDAVAVGGFAKKAPARWEDGLIVLALSKLGRLKIAGGNESRVWTSDRRLMMDGGYGLAMWRRIKRHLGFMPDYLTKKEIH